MEIGTTALDIATGLVLGGGAALFYTSLQDEPDVMDGGPSGIGVRRKRSKSLFWKIFGGAIRALAGLISLLPIGKSRESLEKKLIQAGRPGGLTPDEFHASRIVGIFIGLVLGLFFDTQLKLTPMFTMVLAFIGFIYPGLWLNGLVEKRTRRIFRDLPDMLDILRLAVDAGLDLSSAMKVVVEKGRQGPLLDELEQVEREISLGRTRREAFRNFADRIGMVEINSFVLALIQADQLGASVGPILKVQGEMARTRRWQLAEVLVNKMPMKMLGPLVVFIFPSSFIILFTPLVIQWMQAK